MICAPLFRSGVPVGALSIVSSQTQAFDELAVETTRMMAEFVSTVIRNADELEERRRLVEALRSQGEVVEHMQTALWIWAADGDGFRLHYANAASETATGVATSEIVGHTLEEVLPAAPDRVRKMFRRVAETGEPVDVGEVEYGDERIAPSFFSMKVFPLPEHRVAVTFENVTAQRDANLLFAATFEQLGRAEADHRRRPPDRRRQQSAAAELLGIPHDAALGLLVDDLVPEEPIEGLWDTFRKLGRMEAEVWLQRPDGARRRIEFVATANVRPSATSRSSAISRGSASSRRSSARRRRWRRSAVSPAASPTTSTTS